MEARTNGAVTHRRGAATHSTAAPTVTHGRPWPTPLGAAARIGILGNYLDLVELQTEADPAAIALTLLTYFGNAIHRGPHFIADGARHGGNLFAVIVGDTATGRKGTAEAQAKLLLQAADPDWTARIAGGASSGEGIIHHVRDPTSDSGKRDKEGKPIGDPGATDKRLLVHESEFARVLAVGNREGSTLAMVLRQAWDGSPLSVLTKSPYRATDAHVSLLGHVTPDELSRRIRPEDFSGGTANRILWCCSRRQRLLPLGGKVDPARFDAVARELRRAIDTARCRAARVEFAREAELLWCNEYTALTRERPGRVGEVTGRAAAQVRRLAMLYALLDSGELVEPRDLAAALEVWRYCEDSARFLFGNATDHLRDKIAQALQRSPRGLSREGIQKVLSRREDKDRIDAALAALCAEELVHKTREATKGRPKTIYRWVCSTAGRDESDESHRKPGNRC